MEKERLMILLYNAIVRLEDYGCDKSQCKEDLGMTDEEYQNIMDGNNSNV